MKILASNDIKLLMAKIYENTAKQVVLTGHFKVSYK